MRTLIIDNYDSFTCNLFHLLQLAAPKNEIFEVLKNDEVCFSKLQKYHRIVASPGPGLPCEAGSLLKIFTKIEDRVPYFGVCLGHQALAEAYGARLCQLPVPVHGGTSQVVINNKSSIFKHLNSYIIVARYHSWVVERNSLPCSFEIISETKTGIIMGLQHRNAPLYGVQFHPESFMTSCGLQILQNFYNL